MPSPGQRMCGLPLRCLADSLICRRMRWRSSTACWSQSPRKPRPSGSGSGCSWSPKLSKIACWTRKPDLVAENSGYLRSLYSVVKGRDDNLSLSFLTDVSKFSKVSL